jgi:FkbM family methyltransferase
MDLGTYWQVFVQKEYAFKANKTPNVIVDAGANIGLASIYFANRFPNTPIISIEPEFNNFELLRKNIEPYKNIIPLHCALWNTNKEIDILDTGLGTNGFMTLDKTVTYHINTPMEIFTHKVKTITIQNILAEYNLNYIDILKIDIEGAEKEVFENADVWIERISAIIIELHERMKPGCDRIFYTKTTGFSEEWTRGENVYLARNKIIERV